MSDEVSVADHLLTLLRANNDSGIELVSGQMIDYVSKRLGAAFSYEISVPREGFDIEAFQRRTMNGKWDQVHFPKSIIIMFTDRADAIITLLEFGGICTDISRQKP